MNEKFNERNTLDEEKTKMEIEKLRLEVKQIDRDEVRRWLSTVTVIFGVVVSVASLAVTLWGVSDQVMAQAEEAKIRSQQLFLTEIIDRIAGTKEKRYHYDNVDDEKILRESVDIRWGNSSQNGAMFAAANLAQAISHLCPTVRGVFEDQASRGAESEIGSLGMKLLKKIDDCSIGGS